MDISKFLSKVPDKTEHKSTTSKLFKTQLYECFRDSSWRNTFVIEIGTSQGYSTYFLSKIFQHVYTLEIDPWNIDKAKEHCSDSKNITFIQADAYRSNWLFLFPQVPAPIVFIDCDHSYLGVQSDISNALSITSEGSFLIFDDYGNPRTPGVKQAINEAIQFGWLSEVIKIGHKQGEKIITNSDWTLADSEGIICRVER